MIETYTDFCTGVVTVFLALAALVFFIGAVDTGWKIMKQLAWKWECKRDQKKGD